MTVESGDRNAMWAGSGSHDSDTAAGCAEQHQRPGESTSRTTVGRRHRVDRMWNVDELAGFIAASLRRGEGDGQRIRYVRQFLADAARAGSPADLIATTPRPTGDNRWDALLAGIVEDFAFHHHLAVPRWTLEPSRFLDTWWFVSSIPDLHPTAMVETPPAVANRGVFIRRASLINV